MLVTTAVVERDRSEVHLMPCGKPNARHNPPELWTSKEHAHEALIDLPTWEAVQAKVVGRKRSNKGSGYQTHTSREDRQPYLLTGLLVCQHCGRKMHGTTTGREKNGKTYRYQKYICSGYTRGDRSCGHNAISQDAILSAVLGKIRQDLLQGSMEGLKASLRKQLQACTPVQDQAPQLRRRLAELDKQISTGAKRVLTAPEELLELLTTQLQAMKREREQLSQQLQQAQQVTRPVDADAEADRLARKAWGLVEELQQADPARVRELLRQAIDRVELSFTATQQGKRQIYLPTGGKVVFRELSGFASRGDRTPIELFLAGVASWEPYVERLLIAA